MARFKDLIRRGAEQQLEDTGVLSSSTPPPLQLTWVVGQGTTLSRGLRQSAETDGLQRIPEGCASPPSERSFSYLGLVYPKAVLLEEAGKAHLKCKGILRAIFETVFL